MMNITFSVVKNVRYEPDEVESYLTQAGWSKTGEALNGRFRYLENSGINITLIDGMFGTTVIPSGPLRGAVFGSGVNIISSNSGLGIDEEDVVERVEDKGNDEVTVEQDF